MLQEEKQLLLQDLCVRLPYGVKVCIKLPNHQEKIFEEQIGDLNEITKFGGYLVNSKGIDYRSFNLDIKPYLRSMSSMTEEEMEEFEDLIIPVDGGKAVIEEEKIQNYIEFCLKHHFDYRGLIEMGLALEAPDGMYKTE